MKLKKNPDACAELSESLSDFYLLNTAFLATTFLEAQAYRLC